MEAIKHQVYERIELSDFILELISEEIPAKMQASAMRQLETLTFKKVGENGLIVEKMIPFVTPMRLGIILENISIEVREKCDRWVFEKKQDQKK